MVVEDYENYIAVVGTGPVGLSIAYTLLKHNEKVCLIDVSSNKFKDYESITTNNIKISFSYKTGGLSNYWGSNFDLFEDSDLEGWPINSNELYKQKDIINGVFDFLKSEKKTRIEKINKSNLELSNYKKLNKVIESYNKNIKYFTNRNIILSNATHLSNKNNFDKFNSAFVLDNLLNNKKIFFLKNHIFLRFEEVNYDTFGIMLDMKKNDYKKYKFKKILICCGSINSTLIFARSKNCINKKFIFSGNNLKVAPVFSKYPSKNNSILSKFFINFVDSKFNSNNHIQIYDFNKEYVDRIDNKFLFIICKFFNTFFPFFMDRIFISLIYLDSKFSNKLEIKYYDSHFVKIKNMKIIFNKNNEISKTNLYKNIFAKLNLLFFPFLSFDERIGACNHLGSSLPMSKNPDKYETDLNGRISGSKNVHILDSTILPSIPSKPITFITILNALRITNNLIESIKNEKKITS